MSANTLGAIAGAPDQADLSMEAERGWEPHVLGTIPWRRKLTAQGEPIGAHPGVGELAFVRHLAATAMLNDYARAGINADVRLDEAAFAELLADPNRPERGSRLVRDEQGTPIGIDIQGPGPQEWRADNRLGAFRPGTHWWRFTTTEWREVPAFVAHWFVYQQLDDSRLGASYRRSLGREERDPDQGRDATAAVASVSQRLALAWEESGSPVPPRDLFVIRMPCERAPGERASGLIDTRAAETDQALAEARAEIAKLQARIDRLNKKEA